MSQLPRGPEAPRRRRASPVSAAAYGIAAVVIIVLAITSHKTSIIVAAVGTSIVAVGIGTRYLLNRRDEQRDQLPREPEQGA